MRVTVVGAGALGSHLVQFIRVLKASIKVIDFDRIEQHNTLSQFHPKSAVGKGKVVSLQQSMQFLWGTKIEVVPFKLVANNTVELLGNSDLIVDCLDNAEARRIVQGYVRGTMGIKPCVHGALAADGAFGRVVWDHGFVIDEETTVGRATCEDGGFLPFIALVSSYLALAVQRFVEEGEKVNFNVFPGGGVARF